MLGKVVLLVSALVFIGYGLVSLIDPAVPAGLAGLVISNGNAYAEIGAMYGGLQTGIGIFCLLAVIRPDYYRGGLAVLAIGVGTLAAARLFSALVNAEPVTFYSYGAFAYEILTALLSVVALRQAGMSADPSEQI